MTSFAVGDSISVDRFEVGQKVDVTGQSKGKGFAGVIKRYNFAMQDATHGNSISHRAPGSIGQCQTLVAYSRVRRWQVTWALCRVTTQTLEVVRVDQENNLLLVKGAVPGAKVVTYRQACSQSQELIGVGTLNLNISEPGKGVSDRAVDVSEATFGRQFNEALVHQVRCRLHGWCSSGYTSAEDAIGSEWWRS